MHEIISTLITFFWLVVSCTILDFCIYDIITEYADHHSRNRTPDAKLWNQFFGSGDKLKQEAFAGLLEMV